MHAYSISPLSVVASAWTHRSLLGALIRREIVGRYQGSVLGILWSLFNPILMLAVYTFFFGVVFRARWLGGSGSRIEFALVLFAGLLVFNFFSECITRAPGLVIANVNYVKKIIFPLELLPLVSLGSAAFHLLVSYLVWLLFYAIAFGAPRPGVLLFPVLLVPLLLVILGLSWLLSSLGVYLRDVSQVVGAVVPVLLFLSPVFYPVKSLPEAYRPFVHASPITIAVEQVRDAMYWGLPIDWQAWFWYLAVAAVVAFIGFSWFQKTRKGFADVL